MAAVALDSTSKPFWQSKKTAVAGASVMTLGYLLDRAAESKLIDGWQFVIGCGLIALIAIVSIFCQYHLDRNNDGLNRIDREFAKVRKACDDKYLSDIEKLTNETLTRG